MFVSVTKYYIKIVHKLYITMKDLCYEQVFASVTKYYIKIVHKLYITMKDYTYERVLLA